MLHVDVRYHAGASPYPWVAQRDFRALLKEAWRACGMHLFDQFVQKHFAGEGKTRYEYAPRAGEDAGGKDFWRSYTGRKQKKFHHTLAMVLSGRTREGARRSTIYATSNGCRVALPGVVHLNQYKPRPKKLGPHAGEPPIDLREELLRVANSERDALGKIHEAAMVRLFYQHTTAEQSNIS